MFLYVLAWIICFYGASPQQPTVAKTANSVRVYGTCYNAGTGVDLKVRLFALFQKSRRTLGESSDAGDFDFQIPDSTKYLSFECKGFRTATIPVRFLGTVTSDSKFRIGVPMSPKESLPVQPMNQLVLCFTMLDSLDVTCEVKEIDNADHVVTFNFRRGKPPRTVTIRDFKQGSYVLTASTADGRTLLNEQMTAGLGINFKAVYLKKSSESKEPALAKTSDKGPANPFDTKTSLYFEQSSYELRKETKASLDSIARLLIEQPNLVAHLTGYTDNVGKRELNVTLSEYRARMVEGYLRQKGVPSHRLVSAGKGPDSSVAANEPEEAKSKSRRVVIQLSPR